jgi:hypothetical protein
MKGSHLCGRINHMADTINGAQQLADPERLEMVKKVLRTKKNEFANTVFKMNY